MESFESRNLVFRDLSELDVSDQYVSWLNDEAINKYLETRHYRQTIESCQVFVENCNLDACSHLFGIFLKMNGEHIGNIKIGFINDKYKRGELSLFIGAKQYWGNGFGAEAVTALSKYSFEKLGLEKIEAGCYEDNLASLRIFIKSGFVVEGFKRGHFVRDEKRLGCFLLGLLVNEII